MNTKTFRVTISFDEDKEADIIGQLEGLADRRQLGSILSNLIRLAYDSSALTPKNLKLGTSPLSPTRQQFFNELSQKVQEQDKKIDTIYSMCEDLYGLARANKAMGLEDKANNLMLSQFVLQRQQTKLKGILGEDNIKQLYKSDRLLNESKKADKIWEFIAGVYEGMIKELRSIMLSGQSHPMQAPPQGSLNSLQENKIDFVDDDTIIELVEKPTNRANTQTHSNNQSTTNFNDSIISNNEKISVPTGDRAQKLLAMMKKRGKQIYQEINKFII